MNGFFPHLEIATMIASASFPEPQTSTLGYVPAAKLAGELGVSLRTITNWIANEVLPQPIHIRGRRYFKIAEIQAWLSSQSHE
jgi:predicted DNA-binding transcriptional regulator AlpA